MWLQRLSPHFFPTWTLATGLAIASGACNARDVAAPAGPSPIQTRGSTNGIGVAPEGGVAASTTSWSRITTAHFSAPTSAASSLSSPAPLQFAIAATTVTLTWAASNGPGETILSYIVEVGSSAGATNLGSFDTGNTATSLTVNDVAQGAYFVRVRGRSSSAVSAASNEVVITVAGMTCTPAPPTGLAAVLDGSTANFTWNAPSGSCPALDYRVEAGRSAGASDVAVAAIGSRQTTFVAANVAAGTYFVRVRALNAANVSPPSNEIAFTVSSSVPPATGLTGSWIGLVSNNEGLSTILSPDCDVKRLDVRFDLTQAGTALTGTLTGRVVAGGRPGQNCVDPVGQIVTIPQRGTVGTGNSTFVLAIDAEDKNFVVNGTVTGTRMTGSVSASGGESVATFVANRQP